MIVAITSSGSTTGTNIITSLKEKYGSEIKIIACDMNPHYLVASSVFADEYFQLPLANDLTYTEEVEKLITLKNIDFFWPVMDYEIHKLADELPVAFYNKKIVSIGRQASLSLRDKREWSLLLEKFGFIPKCVDSYSEFVASEQWFIKPKSGVGSKGAKLISSGGISHEVFTELTQENVIQEVLIRPEITIDAFCLGNECFTVCRERIEVKSGVCSKARVYSDATLNSLAKQIAQELKISGSFCFQVMLSPLDRTFKVIDINPRTGGATSMSKLAGCDFVNAHFSTMLNESYEGDLTNDFGEKYILRTFKDVAIER